MHAEAVEGLNEDGKLLIQFLCDIDANRASAIMYTDEGDLVQEYVGMCLQTLQVGSKPYVVGLGEVFQSPCAALESFGTYQMTNDLLQLFLMAFFHLRIPPPLPSR